MKTGEGKTLVATLPTYLNALAGDGVHVVTVNDYLAKRDSDWMGQVYRFLGMTTGTYPKAATATAHIDGVKVTINGIAKGSGMIAPDMATMLSFVFTDANLPAAVLQECLGAGVGPSSNSIAVDSDPSTSDTLMLFATGRGARHAAIAKATDK